MSSAFNPWTGPRRLKVTGAALAVIGVSVGGYYGWGGLQRSPGGQDTQRPAVALTAPSDGATVSGSSVTVSASCSDNVGCVGVQFQLNGANLNSEVTVGVLGVYTTTWDSSATGNGTYTLSAFARDAANNTKTSVSESITVSGGAGGGAPLANEWVNTSAGVSPSRCSSACAYDSTHAYGSIQAAYAAASCNDIIAIKAGTYTRQTMQDVPALDSCLTTSRVTVQPDTGATVILNGLTLGNSSLALAGPQHLDFIGIQSTNAANNNTSPFVGNDFLVGPLANDIVMDGVTIDGNRLDIAGASNVTIKNSTIKNCIASDNKNCPVKLEGGSIGASSYNNANIAFTNVVVKDFTLTQSAHIECLFVQEVIGLTITNSDFHHCQIFDIFMQQTGLAGTNIANVVIKNTLFGESYSDSGWTTPKGTCVILDGNNTFNNVNFSFNSMWLAPSLTGGGPSNAGCLFNTQNGATVTNSTATGNIMVNEGCIPGVIYDHNVWAPFSQFTGNSTCGTGDVLLTYSAPRAGYTDLTDIPTGDWTLAVASAAIGIVPVASCPAGDNPGTTRPAAGHSSFCNAGAYENR